MFKKSNKFLISALIFFNYALSQDFPIFENSALEQKQILLGIEKSKNIKTLDKKITGMIVPHHLLAADLIAQAFASTQKQSIEQIIILAPDHFRRSKTAFSVPTERDFLTFLGKVSLDKKLRIKLLELPEVSASNLFSHEHSIRSILPFIAYYLPNSKILPIVIKNNASKNELENLISFLKPILTKNTIIIQSTDFSHYLTAEEAKIYDQQSLKVLHTLNPDLALNLNPSKNVDSPKAMFLQMKLQNLLNSKILVLANKNSADYIIGEHKPLKTTSYILAIYYNLD